MKKRGNAEALVIIAALLSAALLLACGAAGDDRKMQQLLSGTTTPAATVVGMKSCTQCHWEMTSQWLQTPHGNMDLNNPGNLNYTGNPTYDVTGTYVVTAGACKNCHDLDTDSANLIANVTGAAGVVRPVVGCEACHGGGSNHNGAGPIGPSRLGVATISPGLNPIQVSGWANTCMACHELINPADGSLPAAAAHQNGGTPPSTDPDTNNRNIITDTHFATPGVFAAAQPNANTIDITGYAMDFSSEKVCSNCHNSHNSSMMDINRAWAQSKHADMTLAGAWAHFKWDRLSRTACQRCKSVTGFAAYADALAAGNTSVASGINNGCNPPMTASDTAPYKPQMLHCNGCHKDNRGTLRNPGAVNANYDVRVSSACGTLYSTASHQYPNLGGSNICILCHAGRKSGQSIKNLNTQGFAAVDFSNLSFRDYIEIHDFASAGTMFAAAGYEYPGRSYANPSSFVHDKIGTSALSIDGGTNGPCVGCHMYRSGEKGNHLFTAVGKTGTAITSITSDVCSNATCHPGSKSVFATEAEIERQEYEDAISALCNELIDATNPFVAVKKAADTCPNLTSPFFVITATTNPQIQWLSTNPADLVTDGSVTGKHNAGAAQNYVLLQTDAGAFVHNNKYARRLIYDSLDWADDNNLNYSVGATLDAAPHNAGAWQGGAKAFLLPSGKLGTSAERP